MTRLFDGSISIPMDLELHFSRTSNGLEIYMKSEYLGNIGNKINSCSSYNHLYVMKSPSTNEYGILKLLRIKDANSKIILPAIAPELWISGVTITYDVLVSDITYKKLRTKYVEALYLHIREQTINMCIRNGIRVDYSNTIHRLSEKMCNKYQTKDGKFIKEITGVMKIGAEIEGGFWDKPDGYTHDGSVNHSLLPVTHHECDESCEDGCSGSDEEAYHGEAVSPAMDIEEIEAWIDKNYPDAMDGTCGIHVHVSFDDNRLSYAKLMSSKFWKYYLKRYKEWGMKNNINPNSRFWVRMEGNNRYCRAKFQPARQIDQRYKESTRYTMLNYCYALHHTLESRMLPTFNRKYIAVSAVKEFYDIVNTYLADNIDEPEYVLKGVL